MTECTNSVASPDSSLIPTENIIEDLFAFSTDFWAQDNPGVSSKRLNSYEDSLSSPESGFSNRSRISSGEDDLESWNQNKTEDVVWQSAEATHFDQSLPDLTAILDVGNHQNQRMAEYNQQLEWTYLEPAQPNFTVQDTIEEAVIAIPANYQTTTQWENYGSNPAVIVQPAWPTNQQTEIQYEIIETVVKPPVLLKPNNARIPQLQQPNRAKKSSNSKASCKDDKPRICHVCGEQAGKHSYYGGQVCPSCRAFFRRSVQSKYSDIYKCSKGGNCSITLKTRKNCQFCRFQACEKAGMKRSWVLADGESNKAKKASPASPNSSAVTSTTSLMPPLTPMCSALTARDQNKIRDCIDKMQMIKQQTEDLNPRVMEEFVSLVTEGKSPLSRESRCAIKKILEQRSRLFALNVPEFNSLSSNDQIILQEENIGPLIELRVATFFHTEIKARQQVDLIFGQSDVLRLTSSLAGMQAETLDNQHLEYEQIFDRTDRITASSQELLAVMSEHKSLIQKISKWVEDETTFCLMNLILLFDPSESRRQLQNPELIESHQIEYAELLYRYLSSRYPKVTARSKLAEGIRLVSDCRQLHQLAIKSCSMTRKLSESQSSSTSSSSEDN